MPALTTVLANLLRKPAKPARAPPGPGELSLFSGIELKKDLRKSSLTELSLLARSVLPESGDELRRGKKE